MFEQIAHALLQEEFWQYIFVMCRTLYASTSLLNLDDYKKPSMDKLYYFVLQTERMLPIRIEDEEDWSKHILPESLKLFWKIINMQQELFL